MLYLVGMVWCFIGVAIVADLFMGAIEEVTTKITVKVDKKTGKRRVVRFWNPTVCKTLQCAPQPSAKWGQVCPPRLTQVANLSLMALGSSAPEIMLNVKEAGLSTSNTS